MSDPAPLDDATFFEHGQVRLDACDPIKRRASIEIRIPCILFQTLSPVLLPRGIIENFRIADPVATWMPQLTDERFSLPARSVRSISASVNSALHAELNRTCLIFKNISQHLTDPADIVPMLPLGIYIDFTYKCEIDRILELLESLESIRVVGVSDFQLAMSSVLHKVLQIFEIPKNLLSDSN
jgi:hypothetical protein